MGLIHHVEDNVTYQGTKGELLKVIRTTWSKIPHTVDEHNGAVEVYSVEGNTLLGQFILFDDPKPIPDHL